ncbi:response regulator transcription factor [Microbacterium caowuchunii]|uniref:Response regulator transcription factor n=1 Tax=Microbacterium caowuchunii TaxID=2614638 RepID=A0A5N0TC60_9MICO|nr:response regulator transcription factor [Microbacterium caowuchunii]KAA9132248.1 response regulator transcription factor [Microbacterium caowuchunii]
MPSPPTPSGAVPPHLLYVEDEAEIAQIVIEVLSEDYLVDHAATGEEALELALNRRYDVIVVDRRLPGMSGADLVRAIRTARIATPVLMLTALGSLEDRVSGLDLGADDYVVKPFEFDELRARLRALRRGARSAGERREVGDWLYTPRARALYAPTGRRIPLTETEDDLLELLTSSPEHVFSREEILSSVFPAGGSAATVDTYVHYVRRKSTPEIIETVRGRGYRAGDPR